MNAIEKNQICEILTSMVALSLYGALPMIYHPAGNVKKRTQTSIIFIIFLCIRFSTFNSAVNG